MGTATQLSHIFRLVILIPLPALRLLSFSLHTCVLETCKLSPPDHQLVILVEQREREAGRGATEKLSSVQLEEYLEASR